MEASLAAADTPRPCILSPSDRLLGAFVHSPPPDPSTDMDSGDFDEHEVFWSGRDPSDLPPPVQPAAPVAYGRRGIRHQPEKQGILAALFEDDGGGMEKQSARWPRSRFLNRKAFVSSPSRMIPAIPRSHELYSQSLPAGKLHQSEPLNVPMGVGAPPPKNGGGSGKVGDLERNGDEEGSDEEEEMLPPHEIVARRSSAQSPFTTFSVLEGRGRTLKGRDLCQVRNAVLTRTGFLVD